MKAEWRNVAPYLPINVPSAILPWAERLPSIIEDLAVESAPRYAPTADSTFCNIYATDIIRNMRFGAPAHWMTDKGVPAKVGQGMEMTANRLAVWFRKHGPVAGWWFANFEAAQTAAERGHLAVAIWQSDGRREPGHIAVFLGRSNEKDEALFTQAGARNFRAGTHQACFGNKTPVEYFIQVNREQDGTPSLHT
jgi:hypothetical protein